MTKYEIMFILSTHLTDEEKKESVAKVEDILAKAGALLGLLNQKERRKENDKIRNYVHTFNTFNR